MSRRLLSLFLFLGLTAAILHGQSVQWDPPRGTLAVGQPGELQLIFESCTPEPNIRLPKVEGLTLEFVGRSTSTSIINFKRSDSVTVTYAALLSRKQRVTIPAFEVTTDKGKFTVASATYEAADATVGASGIPLENVAAATLTPTPASVWAGEVFNLQYSIEASHNNSPDFGRGQFAWNPEPLVAEEWSRPEPYNRSGAEARDGLNYRTRAIARTAGRLRLNSTQQLINLAVGVSGFGFFQQRQYQQFAVPSSSPTLEVKALPPSPTGFNGAVGALKLNSKVVPATAAVGEPITWTLELSGVANWPDINGLPARDVSRDFQVVSPQAKRTPVEGKLFEATLVEDVVLVPTKPGSYTLGALTFSYFDPKLGSYQTITTPTVNVTVTAANAPPVITLPSASATTSSEEAKTKVTPPQIAPLPAALPRDPLPGSSAALLPLPTGKLIIVLTLPFGAVILYWLGLALKRARVTDPLLTRRNAHARLTNVLEQIRSAGSAPAAVRAPLLQWQHDTRLLLELAYAVPTPSLLAAHSAELKALWSESDRTLYGDNIPLPADWTTRAAAALQAAPVPRFSPLRLFLLQNLVPALALLIFASLLVSPLHAAELVPLAAKTTAPVDAAAAYRRGDFLAAEKSWRAALAAHPTDSITRHNLSLALAQQDRWDEASAHAATAFLHSPGSEPIRAQFALSAEKSGHVPPQFASFLAPGPIESLTRLASPAGWQYTLCATAALAALALGAVLHFAYAGRSLLAPLIVLGLTVFVSLAALLGWHRYGEASDLRAVIVWRAGILRSIPSEADTSQKTTPLAAGSLALVDKTFLNDRWQRLIFEGGQTGWVRHDDLVPLWK